MLTFWADSLIDHDEKPRELNVLSHGQCDLWDNHPACLEQKVICAHTPSPSHRASLFCPQQDEWILPESRGGQGLSSLKAQKSAPKPRGETSAPFYIQPCSCIVALCDDSEGTLRSYRTMVHRALTRGLQRGGIL